MVSLSEGFNLFDLSGPVRPRAGARGRPPPRRRLARSPRRGSEQGNQSPQPGIREWFPPARRREVDFPSYAPRADDRDRLPEASGTRPGSGGERSPYERAFPRVRSELPGGGKILAETFGTFLTSSQRETYSWGVSSLYSFALDGPSRSNCPRRICVGDANHSHERAHRQSFPPQTRRTGSLRVFRAPFPRHQTVPESVAGHVDLVGGSNRARPADTDSIPRLGGGTSARYKRL